ncbi:cyclin-T1-4-like [Arachis stenosperma]|uniref:cyclin-T1-4-like n=1 Tax=Arachis stenosperma TaxID=217475 RepID=UPI0025AD5845|nr:cyclin-T1-4-like [Arachis stenosperma]
MSFVRNFEPEGRHLHGGYRSTYDGNNFGNNNRKRSRNDYHHRNYNIQNNNWANFGDHGDNYNFYRADHANYAKYDAVPASLKRRKYAAPAWEDSQMYYLPYTVQNNFSSANFQAPPTRSNADTSTSASLQLDWSIFEDDKPSFMSRDEIDRYSPSRKDGIDVRHETHLRYSYCAYLQNLGMRLELPQTTIGTAMVLCHRFFVRRSHACHDRFLIATAALFLAAKSEESPRPLNNVLRASSEILHKQDFTMLSYLFPIDWFEQYRERLFEAEQLILTTLNFELNVQHPYAPLTSVLNKLGLSKTILVNLALNLVSEGLRSSLWLQFKPEHIAAGAAYLAAKFLNMDLAADRNIWQEFQTTPSILQDVSQQLLELF